MTGVLMVVSTQVDGNVGGGGSGGGGGGGALSDLTAVAIIVPWDSNNATCGVIVSGGTSPYTYQWHVLSGDATISSGGTTAFCTFYSATETNSVVYCEVTDAASTVVTTDYGTIQSVA